MDQTHPLTYIQDLIMREVHKHQRNPGHQTFLMGDLNSSWTNADKGGAHPALQHWANKMGWDNPSRTLTDAHPDLSIRTNWTATTPTSWIDHILTYRSPSTPTLLGAHLARSPSTVSDKHRLFWNSFRIPGGPPQPRPRPIPCPYHRKKRKVPNIFRDKHTTAEYQTNMMDWFNTHPFPMGPCLTPETAGEYLQHVSEASTRIGLGGIKWKYKRWKSYRDGWTPHMLANQAQYHFLLKIQRHLLGQHGYTKWSPSHTLPNICNLTFPWEEAIHKAFCGDPDPEAVNRYQTQLRYNPTYYRNLTTAPTREFIAKEITLLRRTNQTRRAQDRADHATEYRKMLHDTYEKKQYGKLIKLLTGDFPPPA